MSRNIKNNGIAIGRLAADVKTFTNKDGSTKAKFTLMVRNTFKNKNGEYDAVAIPLETFVPAKTNFASTPWSLIGKGDLVAVEYSVRNNNYTDKNGEAVYDIVLNADNIEFLESKTATQARREKNDTQADAVATPAEEAEA